jgi:hypothetical protein
MLTLLSFRSEETAAKPFLQALTERAGRGMWSAISLEPMTEDEAHTLIGILLPVNSTITGHDRVRMTREAGGSPFVLEQLARYAGVDRMDPVQAPTFAAMFATRLGGLSPDARRFLETLAICGRPMAPELVCDACGVARDRPSLVAMLRASHLIRSSGSSERIETYHDRMREVLATQLGPDDLRRIHGLMVHALVERRSDDCEALFEHYRGAGDSENASIQAALAAARASTTLAFDRAASYYRHALSLTPASSTADAWREGLADALANAGRPAEAADAYLRAAADAGHAERVNSSDAAPSIPHWRTYRSRARPDSHHACRHGGTCAAKPSYGAPMVVMGTRTAAMARTGFCSRIWRRHRRGHAPSRGYLLVGHDGAGIGRCDQRLGLQRAAPAHGARCR